MTEAPVIGRRGFSGGGVAISMIGAAAPQWAQEGAMFGLIGKSKVGRGWHAALIARFENRAEIWPIGDVRGAEI
ncbi:MAG: hypothetical protein P0Y59_00925 [Candidatus Sphingomonas phytovorans]|nr:hypothetical protein [Sphingomonas sp.]WEK00291.1 MAG: hypothetical protein P0Y59_00925 [Sphingomonas sp.]